MRVAAPYFSSMISSNIQNTMCLRFSAHGLQAISVRLKQDSIEILVHDINGTKDALVTNQIVTSQTTLYNNHGPPQIFKQRL